MTRKAIQFRLRSLFILTAIVAVACLVGPPIVREVRERFWPPKPAGPLIFWAGTIRNRGAADEEILMQGAEFTAPPEQNRPTH
jgi:hypothetical protein